VSGKHAQVTLEGQSVILTDLKSTNGTFVNGQRVERVELRPNDWISIGKHILTLKAGPR
jgi:pSer/pThr/pTyr-binding forkhead associated (FHA) protein